MKKSLLTIFFITFFFFLLPELYAQSNQTVVNGGTSTAENFPGGGCTYNWVNSNPSIGLAASGTGNISSFTAVNTGSTSVNATITATPAPTGFAYITNDGGNSVSVINIATNAVTATIPMDFNPYCVAVNHTGTIAYIGHGTGSGSNNNSISVINTATNLVSATIPLNAGPIAMVVSPDDSKLYVANYPSITVINTSTNSIITSFTEGNDFVETGLAISPDGTRLYVSDGTDNDVLVVNTTNYATIADIAVGYNPHGITLSPDGSRLYVPTGIESIYQPVGINDNLTIINTVNDAKLTTIPVGQGPYNVVLNSDGSRAYVANNISNSVSVINTASYQVVATIPVGKGPSGLSSTADGSAIFAVNNLSNNVSVINTATNIVTATIATGANPTSLGNFITPGLNCGGAPVTFTITVNPASPIITASAATGNISACVGTASASPNIQQFVVSGSNLSAAVTATAPTGFEVSLFSGSGYSNSVVLWALVPSPGGQVNSQVVYVRSSASAPVGQIPGNVTITTTGAITQNVAVSGVVNALPTVNVVNNQIVANGAATTAINFTGTGNAFTWTNDTPGIGLAASGTGNIASFMAVNTGTTPVKATVAVTPYSAGFAYVANTQSNNVSVINTITNTVIKTISVGSSPLTVAVSPDDSKVYVANTVSDNLSVISTATNTVIATIPMSVSPSGMIFSPDGSKLYVANIGTNIIYIVNTSTNTINGSLTSDYNGYGMAITPDGNTLYVADQSTHYVSVLNTITNSLITDVPVGGDPFDVVISPDGTTVYSINDLGGDVTVINTATNTVTSTFQVGLNPYGAVISPDGKLLYVANQTSGTISVINTADQSLITLINTGANPSGVSLNGDGSLLYVADHNNGAIVINTATNTVLTKVTVGTTPISLGNFITKGTGCTGEPVNFTITVNPAPPIITASAATGNISACVGTASASPDIQQFSISGSDLTANITATAPAGFELSLNEGSGYSSSLTFTENNGIVSNSIIYVRSSATAPAGNISDEVILSSADATNQSVSVSRTINAIPTVNTVAPQNLINGATTTPVNFTGTANTFSWINDTPGIGLAASGTGDIPSFAVINNTNSPITATITVTPLNSTNCDGTPVTFTITVNPTPIPVPATLTAAGTLTSLTTVYGTPSPAESFTVSGTNITSGISVTPPAGFEVSSDGVTYNTSATISGTGNISSAQVYIRLASSSPVGEYSGNVVISTSNATSAKMMMPISSVTPASLTITADNKIRPFGAVNHALTVTYSGFVNKDGPAQLTAQPEVTTAATSLSAVGQYPISVDNAASPDYTFTYIPGILIVTPSLSILSIPNTFTPNGDGKNDTWVIKNLEYYTGSTINIFNRWGQKMFSSVGYPIPWDGKYQGKELPTGTYYYIIDPKNGQAVIAGWVAIIR